MIKLTYITPILMEDRMETIELASSNEDYSGRLATQAKEHEHLKRRKGYTFRPANQNKPRLWHLANSYHPKKDTNNNAGTNGQLTELASKILEIICLYLPFRALQNLKRTS